MRRIDLFAIEAEDKENEREEVGECGVANALLSSYLCSLKYAPTLIMFATCWQRARRARPISTNFKSGGVALAMSAMAGARPTHASYRRRWSKTSMRIAAYGHIQDW